MFVNACPAPIGFSFWILFLRSRHVVQKWDTMDLLGWVVNISPLPASGGEA
jgi:hypothetical protein